MKFIVLYYLEMSGLYFVQRGYMYRIFFTFTNVPLITMLPIKDNVFFFWEGVSYYTHGKNARIFLNMLIELSLLSC